MRQEEDESNCANSAQQQQQKMLPFNAVVSPGEVMNECRRVYDTLIDSSGRLETIVQRIIKVTAKQVVGPALFSDTCHVIEQT